MNPRSSSGSRTTRRNLVLVLAIGEMMLVACGDPAGSTGALTEETSQAPPNASAETTTIPTEPAPSTTTEPVSTEAATTTFTDALPTTQPPAPDPALSPDATLPPPVPATEHQLAVLAAALSMPGRPDLHDVPYGQEVILERRGLHVNVPIFGAWQYYDLDAQDLPGAANEASEAAARDLLARLGIDTSGLVASFTPNGPGTDVGLAGCIVRFADDGRIAFAYGLLKDVA